ncbi:MAG: hypothetical protein J5793_04770 [Clostridia bacterium]|nr:hypothetical protein [Clostridia bacterium]
MPVSDLTIFISSCDKNSDLWPVFFRNLSAKWPSSRELPVVLNAETLDYSYPGYDIVCPAVCAEGDKEMPWSTRFLKALESVKTEYCYLVLEDFLLPHPVDEAKFGEFMDEIRGTKDFGCCYFCAAHSRYPNFPVEGKKFFLSVNRYSDYKADLSPGLWKTALLRKLVKPGLNIWQAELVMRDRSYKLWRKEKYFTLSQYDFDKTPLYQKEIPERQAVCYDFRMQLVKGKWVPALVGFLKSEGIDADFEKRGIIEHDFDVNAKSNVDAAERELKKGYKHLTRYFRLHNHIIPSLSRIKWRFIAIFTGNNKAAYK